MQCHVFSFKDVDGRDGREVLRRAKYLTQNWFRAGTGAKGAHGLVLEVSAGPAGGTVPMIAQVRQRERKDAHG